MITVEMKNITKRFGTLVASDHVTFQLRQGEIHALLGENGAGKTTLMRILYGLYQADEGEVLVNGTPVKINSPREAIASGIGMVTQHFTLVPTLSVTQNIILGDRKGVLLNESAAEAAITQASTKFGIPVNPKSLVRYLSVGEKQRVEILKALYRNARVLILDEPTAVLVPQEVDQLMETLQHLKADGFSIVFISHKLHEVMTICDRISVLRDGKLIDTVDKVNVTQSDLARMMVGREMLGVKLENASCGNQEIYSVKDLCANDKKGLAALKNVSFELCKGEILGVAGVSGNGQSELAQTLSGIIKPTSGHVYMEGKEITGLQPADVVTHGIGRIPEDRHASVVGEMTVAENMVMEHLGEFTKNGVLDRARIQSNAVELIKSFQIKAKPGDHIRTLSGGNMQKVLLARTLARSPKVIIISQPTRGLDVGATEYIRSVLLEQRKLGAAILLISEDLEEVLALSDRIAVIYEGQIMDTIPAGKATVEQLGLLMAGSKPVAASASTPEVNETPGAGMEN
ncbi:MAG TPA: ABC transporter ATP-binding protein [Anaerolineaceae bacterium]|nr:ABC transporter ATP-binding protein [Anaerolineaceae bacterium]